MPQTELFGKRRRLERFLENRFGHSIADRAAAAAVAHVVLQLVRKHPGVAAHLVFDGLGRGGKVGLREIARRLYGKLPKQRFEKKTLLLEPPKHRPVES